MIKEKLIECPDAIGTVEQEHLLEITSTMARALTNYEFVEILKVYDKAISRVLNK